MGYPLGESEVGAKNINTTSKISRWPRYSPDHKRYPDWSHLRVTVILSGLNNGGESRSGKKIPWTERSMRVRLPPGAQMTNT